MGSHRLSAHEFEVYSYIQSRVYLVSTEEGKREVSSDATARRVIALEKRKAQPRVEAVPAFDPETMTPDEIAAWVHRYSDHFD